MDIQRASAVSSMVLIIQLSLFQKLIVEKEQMSLFLNYEDEGHHRGISPLVELNIGFVSEFCLDPMHLVYLGVMRKLLNLWLKGPLSNRISSFDKNEISKSLLNLSKFIPHEICRKPRSLFEVDRYKATEFRTFLLYTGPICLYKLIDENIYKNFLLLSCAIRMLSMQNPLQYIDLAENLILNFVKHFGSIYGNRYLVYNVHSLIHLCDDVRKFGQLEKFSAFVFENFLGSLKKMIRKPNLPLQQVVNRLIEKNSTSLISNNNVPNYPYLKRQHSKGPLVDNISGVQYRELYTKEFCLKLSKANNGIILNCKTVCRVENILSNDNGDIILIYKKYINKKDFFKYPILSSILDIYRVKNLSKNNYSESFQNVFCKCLILPFSNDFSVCIPLVHTFE